MNIEIGMILASTINFVIFYLILKKFVFKKTIAIIDAREEKVQKSIKMAEEERERAEELKKQYDTDAAKYKQQGIALVEQYKAKADEVYEETVKESKKEAQSIRESALMEIEREKRKAASEIKEQVADLSVKIAEKILEKEIDADKHRELMDDFIEQVGN